jgi:hypothetical protein
MKKASFPKAKSYAAALKAKQIAASKIATDQQFVLLSKLLTNFDKKCNADGIVEVDVSVIGEYIYRNNITVIEESGWAFRKRGSTWQFYIALP